MKALFNVTGIVMMLFSIFKNDGALFVVSMYCFLRAGQFEILEKLEESKNEK